MEVVTITFQINADRLLEAFKELAQLRELKLVDNIDLEKLSLEFSNDIKDYITQDLTGFIGDGYNNDLYTDYFEYYEVGN